MAEEDLALREARLRVSTGVGFSQLVVGFDVYMAAFLERLEVGIGRRVERVDSVPRSSRVTASYEVISSANLQNSLMDGKIGRTAIRVRRWRRVVIGRNNIAVVAC